MAQCPCNSGKEYDDCCGVLHSGERKASTPVELMRARYSAFARGRIQFLEDSLHPRSRAHHDPQKTQEWSQKSEWLGLEIVETQGGLPGEENGHVEFIARYKASSDEEVEHRERAEFRKQDGEWFFFDGKIIGEDPIEREEAKVGRNDPCPCGSGKKYKKCCG